MFFSLAYESTKKIGTGEFACPRCDIHVPFSHYRVTKNRVNFFLIPFGGVEEILREYVVCTACNSHLEASVLLDAATTFENSAVASSLKNVVTLSEAAASEISTRFQTGGFEPGTYVRVIPAQAGSACEIKFDLPYADDREWLGRDHGFSIVIDRELAELVDGMEIHFDGHAFHMRC